MKPPPHAQRRFRAAVENLASVDDDLAAIVRAHGVPTVWLRPAGFASLVLFILEQQVSLASASTTYSRILTRIDRMTPEAVLATTADELRIAGVSRQKNRYLRALATAVLDGSLDLGALPDLPDHEVRRRLEALPGIGRWTSDVYMLACLDHPDVWPVGDRALQIAVGEALALETAPTPDELEAIGERWRPHRSAAARLLWHAYLDRRGRVETPVTVLGPLDGEPI